MKVDIVSEIEGMIVAYIITGTKMTLGRELECTTIKSSRNTISWENK
jgi:hypothetical protein